MARPREYAVDPDQLLRAIHRQTILRRLELDQEIETLQTHRSRDNFFTVQQLHRERSLSDWLTYRAEDLVDGPVSDGLRRAVTREVLRLEAAGLVEGQGRRLSAVRLTPEGVSRVKHLEKKQAAAK